MKKEAYSFWFLSGSQHLYGPEVLDQVVSQTEEMVSGLANASLPFTLELKPILTNDEDIQELIIKANSDPSCAGVITWMHTFSPAKMWIRGIQLLQKPLLHLNTQFNRDIPWDSIDMEFMNLNQSAHGDREFGHVVSRMGIDRKVVVGHWEDKEVLRNMSAWMKVAVAHQESYKVKVARFGDNMRQVAVTDGDKIEAQKVFGWTVDGYGVGDLVEYVHNVSEEDVEALFEEYKHQYEIEEDVQQNSTKVASVKYQARLELGMKAFLDTKGYNAFTTTFEDLHGLEQLPGLAVQRLMEQGYGFAGEGDWKTAALLRVLKQMTNNEGTTFMEDYTYHFKPGNEMVLGSHMLEICPTVANDKPRLAVHPLGIGGKDDPARMIFNGQGGKAVNASIVDLGDRFRLIVSEIEAFVPEESTPKLPVAKLLWKPEPSLSIATEAWVLAGGAHHTVLSFHASKQQLIEWAEMHGVEVVLIDNNTQIHPFKNELKWNKLIWRS
ncbi:L-arabinose isomerase [Paenalkalicoccus suaedae]|uniref:L-arabinose isomerase n=1 Tax=Paenalkalicoccus suaedae TaxID=2592382 RepID=A0A859FIT3_9BACI|nr:L-arabinose isomerase [Paenalkalicoccus suaedae]QKS72830.1 L-arabinose isomerase [Paenalkalicoccus suaedae]